MRQGGGAGPDVTVVIPVHGDHGGLDKTLRCLEAQVTGYSFEVVVVDNGGNGWTTTDVAFMTRAGVRVVEERILGSYRARNTGARCARGRVLAFTDADCLPSPRWLQEGVTTLDTAGSGSFVGGAVRVVVPDVRKPTPAELWQLGHDLRQDLYVRRGWAATANLFVSADDFATIGLFDDHLESGGDRDWGERASGRGFRAVYADGARVDHQARRTLRSLNTKLRRVTRGAAARVERTGSMYPHGFAAELRPGLGTKLTGAREHAASNRHRAVYVIVALWAQYYRLAYGVRIRWSSTRRMSTTPGPDGPT